jgi:hypothetical protein
MGLLDNLAAERNRTANTSSTTRRTNTDTREQAKVWLNVGFEVDGKFVNLPLGLAIDTMEPVQVRGQNQEWLELQTARNELLQAIQEAGAELEPGQERELPLVVRIRHVNDAVQIDAKSNPLSMAKAGISFKKEA